MKATDLDQSWNARQPFRLDRSSRVPANAGCYAVATFSGEVLYIGRTVNLRRRFGEHLDNPKMTDQTPLGLARWFYYKELEANRVERYEQRLLGRHIQTEGVLPPLNTAGP